MISIWLNRTWQIKSHLLHIKATTFAVKSLSSQWLSENLLPNLFATRQVTTDGIIWCSWEENMLVSETEWIPSTQSTKQNHVFILFVELKPTHNVRIKRILKISFEQVEEWSKAQIRFFFRKITTFIEKEGKNIQAFKKAKPTKKAQVGIW